MNDVGESNTLAPPDWKAPSACLPPSPTPPPPSASPTLSSPISCPGGKYPDEIGWSLICDDGTTLSGGAPFSDDLAVALGATCTLEMTDVAGDGWEGKEADTWAQWSGFGQIFFMDGTEANLCREDSYAGSPYAFCSQRTETFVVQAPEV